MENEEQFDYDRMYLDDLAGITPCSEEETEELAARLEQGDIHVISRIVEGNLFRVLPIAREYAAHAEHVSLGDLVQEGNMALTMAAGDYSDGGYGPFVPYIENEIRTAMEKILNEQELEEKTREKVLERVELLNAATQILAKRLGRQADTAELAEFMKMSEDDVKDIAKIALNAMTKNEFDPEGTDDNGTESPAEG